MTTVSFNRKVFVRRGHWQQIAFAELEIGETFELYEADDTLVGVYRTNGKPYMNDDGVWQVEIAE